MNDDVSNEIPQIRPSFPIKCRWCSYNQGILPSGILICPRCDMTEIGGPPNSELAKDVNPKP